MKYRVQPDGSVSDGAVFIDTTGAQGAGAPDGIRVDTLGNVYSSAPGGVWIMDAQHQGHLDVRCARRAGDECNLSRQRAAFTAQQVPGLFHATYDPIGGHHGNMRFR